jgi:hypothetical protein
MFLKELYLVSSENHRQLWFGPNCTILADSTGWARTIKNVLDKTFSAAGIHLPSKPKGDGGIHGECS